LGQPGGAAGVGVDQAAETFAEDRLRAVRPGAAEPAHDQAQGQRPALAGQVGDGAAGTAGGGGGGGPPRGGTGRRRRRAGEGDGGGGGQDEVVQAQPGAGEEVESRQGGAPSGEAMKTCDCLHYRAAASTSRENRNWLRNSRADRGGRRSTRRPTTDPASSGV